MVSHPSNENRSLTHSVDLYRAPELVSFTRVSEAVGGSFFAKASPLLAARILRLALSGLPASQLLFMR